MTRKELRERREAIAKYCVENGVSSFAEMCAVASRFHVDPNTVYNSCREAGLNLLKREKKNHLSPSTYKIIAAMFRTDSVEEIAKECKCSRDRVLSIHKACVLSGIPVPGSLAL